MKMSLSDYAELAAAVKPFDTEANRDRYRRGDYPRSAGTKDVNVRYAFDIFHACGWRNPRTNRGGLYNDEHLATALRKAIPAL